MFSFSFCLALQMMRREDIVQRAYQGTMQGRLLHPIVLVGTVQDACPNFHEFVRLLTGQAAIARSTQAVAWTREVQNLLVRYEGWPIDRACALVAQADPELNLRPGGTMRTDLSSPQFFWGIQGDTPSSHGAPQDTAAKAPTVSNTVTAPAALGRAPPDQPAAGPSPTGPPAVRPREYTARADQKDAPGPRVANSQPLVRRGRRQLPITPSVPRQSDPPLFPEARHTRQLPPTPVTAATPLGSPPTHAPVPPRVGASLRDLRVTPPVRATTPLGPSPTHAPLPTPLSKQPAGHPHPPQHTSPKTCQPPPPGPYPTGKRKRPADEDQLGNPPRKVKDSTCPVLGCAIRHRRIRLHTYKHFPECIQPGAPENTPPTDVALRRVAVLRTLATFLTGAPSLDNLCCLLDMEWHDRVGEVIPPISEEIEQFAWEMWWSCPTPITLQPMSSAALLIHWRPFAFLWSQLEDEERRELRRLGSYDSPLPSDSHGARRRKRRRSPRHHRSGQAPTSRRAKAGPPRKGRTTGYAASPLLTPTTKAGEAPGRMAGAGSARDATHSGTATPQQAPGATSEAQESAPAVFDSHFHLDRLERRLQARGIHAIRAEPGGPPHVPVTVVGGILNYCDPERYREIVFPPNRAWKVAVGIHPRHVSRVDDRMLDQLESLICDTRVAAISELGLDHTEPPERWGQQEALAERILRMGVSGRVLVIHARGEAQDPCGLQVHRTIRSLLIRRCTHHQRVQVHCACTSAEEVAAWLRAFPHCYFSFGRGVTTFSGPQQEALRAVPRNRLLLETDAPYFSGRGQTPHTPAYIGEVAALVAQIRREPLVEVMAFTRTNALRLYGEFHG